MRSAWRPERTTGSRAGDAPAGEIGEAPCVPDAVYTGTGPEQRASWVAELESGSVEARLATIRQIVRSQDRESVRLLITGLENTAWRVREAAFDALLDLGEPAVPCLIESLADSHERVVVPAVIVLGTLKARGAVDPLVALLDDGGEFAAHAAWALGEIGDDRAITPLTKFLNCNNTALRSGVEEALRKFG